MPGRAAIDLGRTRQLRCWLIGAGAALVMGGTMAQDAAKGRVSILVPLAAGSTTDTVARVLADSIGRASGQPVIVVNKPGASGRIAAAALRDASPDGTTLMLAPMAVTVLNSMLYRKLNYDPVRDFAPIAQVAKFRIAFAVGPKVPAASLAEFIAWAREHPVQANFGAAGGLPQLFGLTIAQASGLDLHYVPYPGGAPLVSALIGGQLVAGLDAMSTLIEMHRAGKLRILAVSGPGRSGELPAVATFSEQGWPTLDSLSWLALYAPAKTPQASIERWSQAVGEALSASDVRAALTPLGLELTGSTPQELAATMAADTRRWAPVVEASGLSVE